MIILSIKQGEFQTASDQNVRSNVPSKPQSYAILRLLVTDRLTSVECRATSVAKSHKSLTEWQREEVEGGSTQLVKITE